jgi:hypothetical protein
MSEGQEKVNSLAANKLNQEKHAYVKKLTPVHHCSVCSASFGSRRKLQTHRFESHSY